MTEENGTVFGIDLGTTYSCISYIDNTGNPVIATNLDGERTTPSVVQFSGGDVVVGQVAKDAALVEPDVTIAFVKTLMGKSPVAITVDGQDKSPEEVSSYILRKVTGDASQTTGFSAKNVVITVPAYFGNDERKATENAGKIAGLNVLSLVQEPVAAAVFYGCTKCDENQNILVYDLGGGTFDVTVIQVSDSGNKIDVICSDGNHKLGGRDWDLKLIDYLKDAFEEEAGYDDEYTDFDLQVFQSTAEKVKKQLTSKTETKASLNIGGVPAQLSISREQFEGLTSSLLEETLTVTDKLIENAKSKGLNIDKILLVGGSTYMPQVSEGLRKRYPDIPREINEPNEAVAKGAAMIALTDAIKVNQEAASSHGGDADESKPRISLPGTVAADEITLPTISLATTKSYGTQVLIEDDKPMISNLILKNQNMENNVYSHSERYSTHVEGQTGVSIEVFESDEEKELIEINGREPIMVTQFEFEKPLPNGSPIDVTFTLNANGVLDVLAMEPASGKQCQFNVETKSLSEDEVEKIASNALQMKVE